MHRFFITGRALAVGQSVELPELARQLHKVLRLQPGAVVGILDGDGLLYEGTITRLDQETAIVALSGAVAPDTEPALTVTLYQCSLKADKFEWVLQKGTELGVAHFVPVVSARSIVRPVAALLKKYDRWRAIIREAAEQSGRTRLPSLEEPLALTQAARVSRSPGELRFVPWEEAPDDAPSLGAAVARATGTAAGCNRLALFIGPEGGLQNDEIELLRPEWQPVTLGPRILRAETAALAAVTIVLDRSGGFHKRDSN